MNASDKAIVQLLVGDAIAGRLPRARRAMDGCDMGLAGDWTSRDTSNLISGINQLATTVTTGVVQSRQARYGRQEPLEEEGIGGSLGGASVSTPWGKIAIGGIAGVVLIGGIVWLVSSKQEPQRKAA